MGRGRLTAVSRYDGTQRSRSSPSKAVNVRRDHVPRASLSTSRRSRDTYMAVDWLYWLVAFSAANHTAVHQTTREAPVDMIAFVLLRLSEVVGAYGFGHGVAEGV